MNGELKACFGNDYKYHANALFLCINGNRDNRFGVLQLDEISKILAKLKKKQDEINKSNSENVVGLYSRLNRAIEQIRDYLNGQQNCTQEDANIYLECIEVKMAELYDFVVELENV